MSYMHIDQLYKSQDVLMFREVYALEKIHGMSAHVSWKDGSLSFFAGGAKHEEFVALFDQASLTNVFYELGLSPITVYGEACGGKVMAMKRVYGPKLRFVAFEVRIGESWLAVPAAEEVVRGLGLDFVPYERGPATVEWLDGQRDLPSRFHERVMPDTDPEPREGIVIRTVIELRKNNGERIIAKHKGEAFQETKTKREVSPDAMKVLTDARVIADEWVTRMRLSHVLDAMGGEVGIERIPELIKAMLADIERESVGEVEIDKAARKAIGGRTVVLFKEHLQNQLHEENADV